MVERINKVEFNNISTAITSTNTNEEIEDLIKSYNKLLGRISENVLLQQNFINYVSHEFKTPLAAISGNLEVFAQRDRTPEEYREVAKESLENVYEIENILNNLLLMSGMTKLESSHKQVRVDELIWKIYENWNVKRRKIIHQLKFSWKFQSLLYWSFREMRPCCISLYIILWKTGSNILKTIL